MKHDVWSALWGSFGSAWRRRVEPPGPPGLLWAYQGLLASSASCSPAAPWSTGDGTATSGLQSCPADPEGPPQS